MTTPKYKVGDTVKIIVPSISNKGKLTEKIVTIRGIRFDPDINGDGSGVGGYSYTFREYHHSCPERTVYNYDKESELVQSLTKLNELKKVLRTVLRVKETNGVKFISIKPVFDGTNEYSVLRDYIK